MKHDRVEGGTGRAKIRRMPETLFDASAWRYDAWYETEPGRAVEEVERRLVDALFAPAGDRALDVGCGTGCYTERLARRGLAVTAIDASKEMLARARGRLARAGLEATFIEGDVHPQIERARARFWSPREIRGWSVGRRCDIVTGLHFAPAVTSYEVAMEAERRRAGPPGFVVARWTAPHAS